MMQISIILNNDIKLINEIEGFLGRGKNLKPAFSAIGEVILDETRQRWRNGVAPSGERWAPLSLKYLQSKKKASSPGRNEILVLYGRLFGGMRYKSSSTELKVGTNLPYAATHQYGRGGIPARPFLGFQDDDPSRIKDILYSYLIGRDI